LNLTFLKKALNRSGIIKALLNMVNVTNNERTYLIIAVVSLVFLFSGLVQNPFFVVPVFASPPAYCFEHNCPDRACDNNPGKGTATCCWVEPGAIGPGPAEIKCQTCHVNTNTGEFENCTSVLKKGRPDSSVIAPPPSGVAPPPTTETCPDNTALDAKGNCAPVTQTPKETPSTDQGTTQPSPTDDNKPSKPKLPKGDILKLQPTG
jgi:hypothetical protein